MSSYQFIFRIELIFHLKERNLYQVFARKPKYPIWSATGENEQANKTLTAATTSARDYVRKL